MKKPPELLSGYSPLRESDGCRWDSARAQHVLDFFSQALKLTSGRSAGKPFNLAPWQSDYLATLFGWRREDGTRRYRESLLFVPRKNGKTELAAGVALYMLCCDGEQKPEVYSAAKSRDQASRVFEPAAIMVRTSGLSPYLRVGQSQKRINFAQSHGYYQALASDAATSFGKNPSCVLFDELHTQTNRDLYDGLKTGMGARTQPLFASLTTAGHNRESICHEVWRHSCQVRDGVVSDPAFLPLLYQFEDGDDWSDTSVWRRCNPNLGVTILDEFLNEEFSRAKAIPAYENTFRNLYLNQWTEQETRWLSRESWDACEGAVPETFTHCWAGLDLSATRDITALVLVWQSDDGQVCVKPYFWIPEEAMRERSRRDRVPYDQWAHDGLIRVIPGRSVDYDRLRSEVVDLCNEHNVQRLAIDPWNAKQLADQLEKQDGINVGACRQGFASLSAPSKMLETLILNRRLVHDGNPVLRWMVDNVAIADDAAGNIKPDKSRSSEKIDGVVALVMALFCLELDTVWQEDEIGV